MNIRPRLVATAAVAAAVALALSACSASTPTAPETTDASAATIDSPFAGQTLSMATDANYPPCEYKEDGSDEIIGFDPDVWNEIAKRLGVTLEVEDTQFDSLLPGVQSGRYDFVVGCFSDRAEREEVVTFVDFIYAETSVITTADYDGPITESDPLSVCGETMGAQTGFDTVSIIQDVINPDCVADGRDEVTIQTYPSAPDTYSALYSGRVDFIVLDTAAAAYLNQSAPIELTLTENSMLPKLYLGIPVAKDNTELQDAMLAALQSMYDDGTYAAILDKWDIPGLALDAPGINLATTQPIE